MYVLTKVFSPLNSTIRLSRPHSSSQQLFTLGTNPCHFFLEFLKPTIRQIKITVTITITDMETITIIDLWIEKYVSYRLNKTKNKHKPPTFCSNIVTVYMYENLSQNSSIDCDKGKHLLRYFRKRIRFIKGRPLLQLKKFTLPPPAFLLKFSNSSLIWAYKAKKRERGHLLKQFYQGQASPDSGWTPMKNNNVCLIEKLTLSAWSLLWKSVN